VLRACCCAGSLKPRPLTGSCVHVAAYVQKHRLSCMSSVCQGVVSKCAPVDALYFTGGRSRPAFRRLIRPLGGAMPPKDAADAAPAKRGDTSFSRVQGDWWQKITRDEIRARAPHAAHLTAAGPERWQQFAKVRARAGASRPAGHDWRQRRCLQQRASIDVAGNGRRSQPFPRPNGKGLYGDLL
jgi:hypothetical protein